MVQIKKKSANILQYKIGNNANIANFVCFGKPECSPMVPLTHGHQKDQKVPLTKAVTLTMRIRDLNN